MILPRAGGSRALLVAIVLAAACSPRTPQPPAFSYDDAIALARRQGRPLQAIYLAEAQAQASGWTAARWRQVGDLWASLGDLPRAVTYWQAAARAEPGNLTLIRALAQTYLDLQQWSNAGDALRQLLARRPADAWAHLQLGLIQSPANPRAAADQLRAVMSEPGYRDTASRLLSVLRDNPADPFISMRVGLALADMELWPYAEQAFQYAAAANAPDPLALAYVALARDRQAKDGAPWIQQAVLLAPRDAAVRYLQGLHLRAAGDNAASLDALVQSVALDPENPAYHAELAAAYRLFGDLPRAEYWLKSAVAVSRGDPRFEALLARFYADEADNLTADGITAFESIASAGTDDPDVRAGLAWALYRAGRADDALRQLDATLDAAPDNARALYYRGRILIETGNPDDAASDLRRAAAADSPVADSAALLLDALPAAEATPPSS